MTLPQIIEYENIILCELDPAEDVNITNLNNELIDFNLINCYVELKRRAI